MCSYHPASRKHTVIYDDGDKEKVSLDEVPHKWLDDDHHAHVIGLQAPDQAETEHRRSLQGSMLAQGEGSLGSAGVGYFPELIPCTCTCMLAQSEKAGG
jgi:hypothetical protein